MCQLSRMIKQPTLARQQLRAYTNHANHSLLYAAGALRVELWVRKKKLRQAQNVGKENHEK